MKILNIADELNSLAYHGRGIIIGKSADGKKAITAYFIMGRSDQMILLPCGVLWKVKLQHCEIKSADCRLSRMLCFRSSTL